MADLDWNLIRSFVAVAETGSLSAAASRLAASQPTLGRHVAELEQALGVVLFRRGRARLRADRARCDSVRARRRRSARRRTPSRGSPPGPPSRSRARSGSPQARCVSAYVLPSMTARLAAEEPGDRGRDRRLEPGREPAAARCRYRRPHGRAGAARSYRTQDRRPAALRLRGEILSRPPRPPGEARRSGRPRPHRLRPRRRHHSRVGSLRPPVAPSAFRFRSDNQIVLWQAIRAGNGVGFAQRPLAERDPLVETMLPGLSCPCCRCGSPCTATCAPACVYAASPISCSRN